MPETEYQPERLILVEWVDSHCFGDGKWVDKDEVAQKDVSLNCKSVGWLVSDEGLAITLVAHQTKNQYGGDMTIPKCAITSILVLQPKPEDQQDEFI